MSYLHGRADPLSHSQQDGVEHHETGSLGWSEAGIPAADSTQDLLKLCSVQSGHLLESSFLPLLHKGNDLNFSKKKKKKKGLLAGNEAGTLASVGCSLSLESPVGLPVLSPSGKMPRGPLPPPPHDLVL